MLVGGRAEELMRWDRTFRFFVMFLAVAVFAHAAAAAVLDRVLHSVDPVWKARKLAVVDIETPPPPPPPRGPRAPTRAAAAASCRARAAATATAAAGTDARRAAHDGRRRVQQRS